MSMREVTQRQPWICSELHTTLLGAVGRRDAVAITSGSPSNGCRGRGPGTGRVARCARPEKSLLFHSQLLSGARAPAEGGRIFMIHGDFRSWARPEVTVDH